MAEALEAAVRVDGLRTVAVETAVEHVLPTLSACREAQILHQHQLGGRKAVVDLGHADLFAGILDTGLQIANAYGGLVYLEVKETSDTAIDLRIDNAIRSPLFVLGETTASQWQRRRQLPAPWGELATDKVILTVPGSAIARATAVMNRATQSSPRV